MKKKEKTFSVIEGNIEPCEIIGFLSYGTYLEHEKGYYFFNHACCRGLFYRFGYYRDPSKKKMQVDFVIKKRWHYPFVKIVEFIRLRLPYSLARKLKMEDY